VNKNNANVLTARENDSLLLRLFFSSSFAWDFFLCVRHLVVSRLSPCSMNNTLNQCRVCGTKTRKYIRRHSLASAFLFFFFFFYRSDQVIWCISLILFTHGIIVVATSPSVFSIDLKIDVKQWNKLKMLMKWTNFYDMAWWKFLQDILQFIYMIIVSYFSSSFQTIAKKLSRIITDLISTWTKKNASYFFFLY